MYLERTLEAIKVIPKEAEYRTNVENTINHKLSIVNSDITDEEAEDKLDAQLEQYIKFVQDELSLIPKMAGAQSLAGPFTLLGRLCLRRTAHTVPLMQSGDHGKCQTATRWRPCHVQLM